VDKAGGGLLDVLFLIVSTLLLGPIGLVLALLLIGGTKG